MLKRYTDSARVVPNSEDDVAAQSVPDSACVRLPRAVAGLDEASLPQPVAEIPWGTTR